MTARILVVDDIPANVKLLEAKLTNEYYDVITARSGRECLEAVAQHKPDVVLLDVMMPEMDGYETCKRLKADPEHAYIPVVMVTALHEAEARVAGLEAGADDFISKPINDMALFARIRSLTRLKMMMDELQLRAVTGAQMGSVKETLLSALHSHAEAHILLADDDIIQSSQIKDALLHKAGYRVDTATSPDDVMRKVAAQEYAVVILASALGDTDGLRLASQIYNQEKVRGTPILMIMDEHEIARAVRSLDIGVNDYILAPIDPNELLARVATQAKRKRYQAALRSVYQQNVSMAYTDALTGLYNRRYFDTHLQNMLEQTANTQRAFALMILDVDHFKYVNDTYGHAAGDAVLRQIPQSIISRIRATDLAARYGGEEFVVIMPDTRMSDALGVAERIRQAVEAATLILDDAGQTLQRTLSIGVASAQPDDTPEMLIKRADAALYTAKTEGRNRVVASSGAP